MQGKYQTTANQIPRRSDDDDDGNSGTDDVEKTIVDFTTGLAGKAGRGSVIAP